MATQAAVLNHELPGEFGAPHPSGDRFFRDVTFGFHPGMWHQRLEDLVSKHDGTVLTDADAETADVYVSPYQTDTPGRKGLTPLGLAAYLSNGKVDKSCHPLCWEKDFEADSNTPPVQVISGDTRMTTLLDRAIAAMRGVENAWTMGHDQHGTIPQERDVHHTVLYPATKWYLPDGDWTSLDLTRAACQRLRVALADDKHKFLRHTWLLRCLDNGRLQRPSPEDYLSPDEVRQVINRCDPHNLRAFDLVTAPHLLHTVLKWPAAVSAAAKTRTKAKIAYPEALAILAQVTPHPLPTTFENHRQYQDLMLPMLIHESWEEVRSSLERWPKKEKTAPEAYIMTPEDLDPNAHDTVPDVILLKADSESVTICVPAPPPCEFPDEERRQYSGKDILMLGPPAKPNHDASPHTVVLAQVTGYGPGVTSPSPVNEQNPSTVNEQKPPAVKKKQTLTVRVLKEDMYMLDLYGPDLKFDVCFRLTTTLRHLESLQRMSRLEPWILRMWLDPHQCPRPTPPRQVDIQRTIEAAGLNHSQAVAVETAKCNPFTLIHGPPGAGKTRTIAVLISHMLADDRKILLCAPTNLAVDHVVAQLHVLLDSSSYTKVVRLGDRSKILPAVRERSIKKLAMDNLVFHFGNSLNDMDRDELARLIAEEEARLLDRARIVCTTLSGSQTVVSKINGVGRAKFEWSAIIIDQATQATDPAALGPMFGVGMSTRVVMVGDPRILGAGVSSHDVKACGYGLSFFERLGKAVPEVVCTLNVQYRMSEFLAEIPNRLFYGSKLITPSYLNEPAPWHQESILDKLVWIDVEASREKKDKTGPPSLFRHAEVAATCALLRHFAPFRSPSSPPSIGVASMYAAQADLMRKKLCKFTGVDFHTVDASHGKEKDIIILSLVRDGINLGFVGEARRLNASLTLAKQSLWIVGCLATFQNQGVSPWRAVVQKAKDTGRVFRVGPSPFLLADKQFDEQTMSFR